MKLTKKLKIRCEQGADIDYEDEVNILHWFSQIMIAKFYFSDPSFYHPMND